MSFHTIIVKILLQISISTLNWSIFQPEGIPHDYNVPMYIGVNKGHPVYKNVDLSFPPSVVNGSQRIRVSTIGMLNSYLDSV